VVGSGLVICGLLIAFGIGHSFEEAETEETEPPPGLGGLLGRFGAVAALVPPALLIFYVLAADRLGFLLTGAAIVLVAALAMGARLRLAVPLAVAGPSFIHLVFYKLLRVPLPEGILAAPWA